MRGCGKWRALENSEFYKAFVELEMATWIPEEIENYCKKLIEEVGQDGGFILKSEISAEARSQKYLQNRIPSGITLMNFP